MTAREALTTVAQVILGAAALKAALATLSRPMHGEPATKLSWGLGRFGNQTVEGYDETDDELDYRDLL